MANCNQLEQCITTYLFAELIAEADEHSAVAFPLVAWECQDAGQVVAKVRVLLFAEVANRVEAILQQWKHVT